MSLNGKTALVTGGGRGIGKAIAAKLAAEGAQIVVCGRTLGPLEEVATATKGRAFVCDVSEGAQIASLVQSLQNAQLHIDILVNNAGVSSSASYKSTSDEEWERLMNINALAGFRLIRALCPAMVEKGFGRIVNLASNAGVAGYSYTTAYCASKHAMVGYTRALAVELAKTRVTVNAVCPGWVDTDMFAAAVDKVAKKTGQGSSAAEARLTSMSAQGRVIAPEEVAHLVAMLCAEEASSIHGQSLVIDGGNIMK